MASPNEGHEGDWVTKVRRNGGGYSILNISDKEKAEKLANDMNEAYQTDNYYVEPYEPEKHAYSRHG